MDQQTELGHVLNRLAAATSVIRTRADDAARAERNGQEQLEPIVLRLKGLAGELWATADALRVKRAA